MKKLRELRQQKNLTIKELSQKVNIPQSTIGMYELDERTPRMKNAKKLANFFNCSIDYIMYGTHESKGGDSQK